MVDPLKLLLLGLAGWVMLGRRACERCFLDTASIMGIKDHAEKVSLYAGLTVISNYIVYASAACDLNDSINVIFQLLYFSCCSLTETGEKLVQKYTLIFKN